MTNSLKFLLRVGVVASIFYLQLLDMHAQSANLTRLFRQQVAKSCQKPFIYEKKVSDLSSPNTNAEVQELGISPSTQSLFEKEVEYAVLIDANDAKLKAEYQFSTQKDTSIARLKNDTKELKFQKWCFSKNKQNIVYIESFIHKSYWLYDFSVQIKVFFDENGYYQSHTLHSVVNIPYLGEYFNSQIKGRKK